MENIESSLCINICDNTGEKLSSSKDNDGLKRENKKVLLRKRNPPKRITTGVPVYGKETRKKQIVKIKPKCLKRFEETEGNSADKFGGEIKQRRSRKTFTAQNVFNNAEKTSTEPFFTTSNFSNLNLHPHMVANLQKNLGIDKLTTVQKLAIPLVISRHDALIRSQTGSGKTLTYAVPIVEALHAIRPKIRRIDGVMAVVVVPTRELALQTYEWFLKLLKPYTWVVPGYLAGGEKRKSEKARLRRGVNILVSTPGRLVDHTCHTRNLQLQRVKFLVLDEADRMLDLGYEKDISSIVSTLDECQSNDGSSKWEMDDGRDHQSDNSALNSKGCRRQTILLSATLTKEVNKLAGLTLKDPSKIDASGRDVEEDYFDIPQNIDQWYVMVPPKLRLVVLAAFIVWKCKTTRQKKMLVFCATQDIVDYLTELLTQVLGSAATGRDNGKDAVEEEGEALVDIEFFKLHGNMNQKDRVDVFKSFRDIDAGVLLCTAFLIPLTIPTIITNSRAPPRNSFDIRSAALTIKLSLSHFFRTWLPAVSTSHELTGCSSGPPLRLPPITFTGWDGQRGGGSTGAALLFLAHTEVPFLDQIAKKGIRLNEETVDRCLQNLFAAGMSLGMLRGHEARTVDSAATAVQLRLEDAVLGRQALHQMACQAFTSFVRFYAAYPKESRDCFNVRRLHLGHYAKGFALRDTPSAIGVSAAGRTRREKGALRSSSTPLVPPHARRSGCSGAGTKRKAPSAESRSRMLITSEYASGLDRKGSKKSRR